MAETVGAAGAGGGAGRRRRLSARQVEAIRERVCPGASAEELERLVEACNRSGLDPLTRQIRVARRWDARLRREAPAVEADLEGFRWAAERTGRYQGQLGPLWCGADGKWREVWLDEAPPAAAKVGVLKAGFAQPLWMTARWRSYRRLTGEGELTGGWGEHPEVLLAQVAEALALRKAFPAELAGVYAPEEGDTPPHAREPLAPEDAQDPAALTVPELKNHCLALATELAWKGELKERYRATVRAVLPDWAERPERERWLAIRDALQGAVHHRRRALALWSRTCRREGLDGKDRALRLRMFGTLAGVGGGLESTAELEAGAWQVVADRLLANLQRLSAAEGAAGSGSAAGAGEGG